MDEISREKLLETYEKFMGMKKRMSESYKRFLITEKGKQKKRDIQRSDIQSKKG